MTFFTSLRQQPSFLAHGPMGTTALDFTRSAAIPTHALMSDHFMNVAPPQRGCFVESDDVAGGGSIGSQAHPQAQDPAAYGLKFPQELWKDYDEWWADLKKQARTFVKVHMKLKGAKAEAKIKELLEMEKTNYKKLLPLKRKIHPAIRDSFVLIPGGMFMMGADDISDNEIPIHAVWVSSFLMMDVSVTNRMWFTVMGTRPSAQYDSDGIIFSGDDQPVVGVTWNDATAFAKKVGCVLPSEAQWEYGAKGGRDYAYGTKDGTLSPDLAVYGNVIDHQFTASVKSRPANPFGLYDMCGNVCQWLRDAWQRVYTTKPQINPPGEVSGDFYILHGGSWFEDGKCLRAALRYGDLPFRDRNSVGFRVVHN